MVKIFCVFGTSELPFNRMRLALKALKSTQVDMFIQSGHTRVEDLGYPYKKFLSRKEMDYYYDWCDVLIIQGGVGTITEALKTSKQIIIIPRLESYNEIFGDQFQFAELIAANRKHVPVLYTVELLPYYLDSKFIWNEDSHIKNAVKFIDERINR